MSTITVLFIPADDSQPLQTREVKASWSALYELVGGGPSEVDLPDTGCSMFCNGSGKLLKMDTNHRATLLADQFQAGFAARDYVAGDAIVFGESTDGKLPSGASAEFLNRAAASVPSA